MSGNWKIYVTTFNCAKSFPFGEEDKIYAILDELLPESFDHDIYALGFQELISTWEASFPSLTLPLVEKLGNSIARYVNEKSSARKFRLIKGSISGAVGLVTLVDERIKIEKVTTSTFRCGLLNSSLKGSASICCSLRKAGDEQETFSFICSHLNANEGAKNAELRVSNYASIMSACATDFRMTRFKESHIFFFGDLNFRAHGWEGMNTDLSVPQVFSDLLKNHDELKKLQEKNLVFQGFEEPPVNFPPTYKYLISRPSTFDTRRTASWCDRVLFRRYSPKSFEVCSYKSIARTSDLQFTDHQAVVLDIKVPSGFSPDPLDVAISATSPQQLLFGDVADTVIGYVGWGIARKVHYWIAAIFVLMIIYRLM